jgi:hypothetical protein
LNDEPTLLTEKAFALSVYYRTLRDLLTESNVRKEMFTSDEAASLAKLQTFLKARDTEITASVLPYIQTVDRLIANDCDPPHPASPSVANGSDT